MFCHIVRQHRALKEDQLRSGVRFTLSVPSAIKNLLPRRRSRRTKLPKLDKKMVCTLGEDISRVMADPPTIVL